MVTKRRHVFTFLVLLIVLPLTVVFVSCDSGGNSSGQGTQVGTQTSTISGRVSNVIAKSTTSSNSSMLAKIKNLLTFTKTADAQGSVVSGINVTAEQNGIVIDSDVTDGGGNFTLTDIPPGNTELNFSTPQFDVSIIINVSAGSVVELVVTIEPNNEQQPVVVGDMGVESGPIRCEDSDIVINGDIVIDGGGSDDCIRAEDNCNVTINSGDVLLTNCERCIDAEDSSSVVITASSDFNCDAVEDGVRSKDNSVVDISTGNNLSIISLLDNGIRSEDLSSVSIDGSSCFIQGGENAIRVEDSSIVDTNGCSELILTQGPSPSPSPEPSPNPSPGP